MKKALKIILSVVVVLAIVLVGLVLLAKVLITPERVRDTVIPLAEKALERDVSLGEIKVSLFSGIELHDLAINDAQGGELFIASDLVRLRYQLLPLLAMQVVIDEVRIERPQIRVERYHDRSFNFSDLLGKPSESPAVPREAGSSSGATPLSLLVTEVRIENGQLLFFDHLVKDRAPYRHEINDFQFGATGITLEGAVPMKLSGRLNGATLDLNGKVHLKPLSVRADIALAGLDALQFKHYFEELLPGTLNALMLNLETSIEGGLENLSAVGRLSAADLDLTLDALPEAPLENARLGIDYDLKLDRIANVLGVTRLQVDFNGIVIEAAGQIDGLAATPRADLKVSIPDLDLRQAVKALPAGLLGPAVADLDPAGILKGEATLVGTFDQPQSLLKEASLTLGKLQATAGGQRPSLDGRILLTGDRLRSEQLILGLGDNTAELQLAASNLFDTPFVVRADLTSKRFALDPLLHGGAASAAAGKPADGGEPSDTHLGPFDLPVRAEGEVRIGETLWKGLVIRDFAADYVLRDNVLTVSRMDGQVAGGAFKNKARVDLGREGLAYSADLDLSAIQVDPLMGAFAPAATGSLFGQLDLNLSLAGAGTEWPIASKQLTGTGEMSIGNGRLVSPGLVQGLAAILQLPERNEFVFETFTGNIRVKEGKLLLDSKINTSQIRLYPKGSVGLDGGMDLSLDARLSPELSTRIDSSGNISRYLKDDQGWSQLPLKLGGSITAPKFSLDAKGLQQGAGKAIQQEIEKQLGERLLGTPKTGDKPDSGQQQKADPANTLLKGLFGQ